MLNSRWIVLLIFIIFKVSNSKPLSNNSDKETCELGKCSNIVSPFKPSQKDICNLCYVLMPLLRFYLEQNKTEPFDPEIVGFLCKELNLYDPVVCNFAAKSYEMSVISIAKDSHLSSSDFCDVALDCGVSKNPLLEWNITLPNVPKPPIQPLIPPKPDAPKIRILQLADIHIDFEYQPGSIADCDQPLCCRNSSTKHKDITESSMAGYWGDYRNCDIPLWTVDNMFKYISENEKFDFIYWTGDLPPHNVWNQTKGDQLSALKILTKIFIKYFPNKIIFPSVGNHEAQPCNLFPTPYVKEDSIDWLYTVLANEWTITGLPSHLSSNISDGAFYTIKLSDKLRLISLNTNYCFKDNFWLLINSTDPLDQLKWLAEILQESEYNKEKVHIIAHIHPKSCLYSWSYNYYKIVNRYESIITAQIFGHSHYDELNIFYDLQNLTRPISVSYLGYRIYTVDGDYEDSTWQVIDHETFFLNLTDANLRNELKWQKEYSAKEAYGLDDLFPESWNDLTYKFLSDPFGDLANKYYKFYSKMSEAFPECDLKCRKNLFCGIKQSRSDHFIPC